MTIEGEYKVSIESPAWDVLQEFEIDMRHTFLEALKELEIDPFFYEIGGRDWLNTRAFGELEKAGYLIRRLRARVIDPWRVFYFVSRAKKTVLVKEIVERAHDTYYVRRDAPEHVLRIKKNFRDFQQVIDR